MSLYGDATSLATARIAALFQAEQGRWVLWLPVFLGSGIAAYFALPAEPPLWLGPALTVLLAVWAWRRRHTPDVGQMAVLALLAACLGFSAASWRTVSVAQPLLQRDLGPVAVEGRVVLVERQPAALRVTLDRPRIGALSPSDTPHRLRLRLSGQQPVMRPGDWIRVRAKVKPPSPPVAPGAFDFQRHSYFKGLGGMGFAFGPATVTARGDDVVGTHGWGVAVAGLRAALFDRITQILPGTAGAVAAALMTGDRSAIPADAMAAIRDSGLAHLLAISGLHIGLVAGIVFFAVRAVLALIPALALSHPIKKWAAAAAVAGAFAYAQIAGATVPTQRAFFMVALVLLAVMVDRRGISLRLVAWAAAVILLFQPESLLGPSFQMSFAAVTGLIAAYELARRRGPKPRSWMGKLAAYAGGVAFSTLIASAATAPFVLYHFNHVALYSMAANTLAVPVTALWVMPFALVAFLLMPLGLDFLPLAVVEAGVSLVLATADTVSAWPGGQAYTPAMPTWGLAVAALGGLWLCLWARRWRLMGVPVLAAGLASVALTTPPDVLVDAQGRLMAVRDADGQFLFSDLRANRFARKGWLARAGLPPDQALQRWPDQAETTAAHGKLRCDGAGCLYGAGGTQPEIIAFAQSAAAVAEDCAHATVIIASHPIPKTCSAPIRIDRQTLAQHGAHALWLTPTGIRVETVNESRGNRPWVIKPSQR